LILVEDIISWVARQLKISERSNRASMDGLLGYINDAVREIGQDYPVLQRTETFTTQDDEGVYFLSAQGRPLEILGLTTPWKYPVEGITTQELTTFKNQVGNSTLAFPFVNHPSQPTYYALQFTDTNVAPNARSESPRVSLEFADASNIAGDNQIVVRYSFIPSKAYRVVTKGDILDIGEEYETLIKYFVARETAAEMQIENRIMLYDKKYKEEKLRIQLTVRRRKNSSQPKHRQWLPY
jgi:hypothetical protein